MIGRHAACRYSLRSFIRISGVPSDLRMRLVGVLSFGQCLHDGNFAGQAIRYI